MIGYVRLVEERESGITLESELSAIYYNTCHYTAVTAQKLCCGVDNKVCAPLYRSAKIGCCEGAVYYKRDAVLVGYLADLLDIRYVCVGVADSSVKNSLVLSVTAFSQAERSSGSTNFTVMPILFNVIPSRFIAPP